jgi:4-hydroxybutyrate CoA-transferase
VKTVTDVLSLVEPGHTVFIAGFSGHPHELASGIVRMAKDLRPIRIITAVMLQDGSPLSSWPGRSFGRIDLLYAGKAMKRGLDDGWADYLPVHLSRLARDLDLGKLPIDVACIQVSPPDSDGRCHFGVSVDVLPQVVAAATVVLAQVNPALPRPQGAGWVDAGIIDAWVEVPPRLSNHRRGRPSKTDEALAGNVADLVPDRATLQFGIGGVMDAIALALVDRRGLGIHSSVFTDGAMRLLQEGAVDNENKHLNIGCSVATMAVGSRELYRFVDANPLVSLEPASYTHAAETLAKVGRLTAINSAFEVDLGGAVNAEMVGSTLSGAVGGQADFTRGARSSNGGRSIMALHSTAHEGTRSRIVPYIRAGRPVTTPRSDVEWVVTEHGAVDISMLSLADRAEALIAIADPRHRSSLSASIARES